VLAIVGIIVGLDVGIGDGLPVGLNDGFFIAAAIIYRNTTIELMTRSTNY